MTLDEAVTHIQDCAGQMNARYHNVVFDEWAIVSLEEQKGRVLAYIGPRKAGFQKNFLSDSRPLREGLLSQEWNTGDFEFNRNGVGTCFEAFMVLGRGVFLICNNTVHSMDAISKDPLWLNAQVPFVELSDRFRQDAVLLDPALHAAY